jgi:hypothetical protein
MWSMRSVALELGLVVTACVVVACSSDDTEVNRRGGPIPSSEGGAKTVGGGASSEPIAWCDALVVIKAKCQRCHGDPLQNAAPMPLMTFEDTHGPWSSTQVVHDVMLDAVSKGFMPYVTLNEPPNPIMPPVEPLTAAEKVTLLGWLQQGALPEGGTDCP